MAYLNHPPPCPGYDDTGETVTRAQPESSRSLRRRVRCRLKPQGSVWSPDSRLLQHGAGPAWGPLASSPPPKSLGHSGTSDAVSVRRLPGGDIRPQAPHAAECSSPRPPPPRHVLGRVTFRLPVARSPSPSSTWGPRALPDTWSLLGTRVWAGEWVTQARGRWHPAARPCSSAHSFPCPGHTGSAETLSPHLAGVHARSFPTNLSCRCRGARGDPEIAVRVWGRASSPHWEAARAGGGPVTQCGRGRHGFARPRPCSSGSPRPPATLSRCPYLCSPDTDLPHAKAGDPCALRVRVQGFPELKSDRRWVDGQGCSPGPCPQVHETPSGTATSEAFLCEQTAGETDS